MYPFFINAETCPGRDNPSTKHIWNLERIESISSLDSPRGFEISVYWIGAPASEHSPMTFNTAEARDKVLDNIYACLLEMKDKVRTEYIPA